MHINRKYLALLSAAILFVEVAGHSLAQEAIHDPQVLATVPFQNACDYDTSNDDKFLYIVCGGVNEKEGNIAKPSLFPSGRFSNLRVRGEEVLRIYDISDYAHPKEINSYDMGGDENERIIVRNGFGFLKGAPVYGGIRILDVRDPLNPRILSRYDDVSTYDITVSDDGHLFLSRDVASGDFKFIDVSDPASPKETKFSAEEEKKLVAKYWPHDKEGFIKIEPVLYAAYHPQEQKPHTSDNIPIFKRNWRDGSLNIESNKSTSFSAEYFKSVYRDAINRYEDCEKNRKISHMFCETTGSLVIEYGNIDPQLLIEGQPSGISKTERISMLNDIGYWLSAVHVDDFLNRAQVLLQKAIELSPNRAVAYLNLGDVYYWQIQNAKTESDKISLAHMSMEAYDSYHRLSGRQAPFSEKIRRFLEITESKDVCSYVKNAGVQKIDLIYVPTNDVDLFNDGNLVNMKGYSTYKDAHNASLLVSKDRSTSPSISPPYGPANVMELDEISPVSFSGKIYLVAIRDKKSADVTELGRRSVCQFGENGKSR